MVLILGCLSLLMPRVVIILVAIFSDYLGTAYQTLLWPILGFLFMPLTTLAYAWAWHYGSGNINGLGLVAVILAVLIDLGIIGGNAGNSRKRFSGKSQLR